MAKQRKAATGVRHRIDNGPQEVEITAAPPLTPADLGASTAALQAILAEGPHALIAATQHAAKLSKRFGTTFDPQWFLLTDYLRFLRDRTHAPGQASRRLRYALHWRAVYLSTLALTRSPVIAARIAAISPRTADAHKQADETFNAQCEAAVAHATQLLHDRAFALALEGNCEPIYWQGLKVGHVRKFDSKLMVELLRAYVPQTFKTPGAKGNAVTINAGDGSQLIVVNEAVQDELIQLRRESLKDLAAREA